jgi:hypothetical protein
MRPSALFEAEGGRVRRNDRSNVRRTQCPTHISPSTPIPKPYRWSVALDLAHVGWHVGFGRHYLGGMFTIVALWKHVTHGPMAGDGCLKASSAADWEKHAVKASPLLGNRRTTV